MSKMWGGRFEDDNDPAFERFNASLRFDRRLLPIDVRVAAAHARALQAAGILTTSECDRIVRTLDAILEDCRRDPGLVERAVQAGVEDVHSFVELELASRIGEAGLKLNTGRSRNDQVATDLRIYLRESAERTIERIRSAQEAFLDLADDNQGAVLPGYTHLQRAQPILLAHFLLAYFEMLQRDRQRFSEVRRRADVCPLGSAALAGSGYPLDRRLQADLLGFSRISRNSLDAVSDRDSASEYCGAAALLMVHISRLCEDLILYASTEFGFLKLSDRVSTGSSLLPQKKNPDALELLRGKSARIVGNHLSLLTLLKGLPLTYNKDLQEDKEPLFDTVDTVAESLGVLETVLRNCSFNRDRMREAARTGYTNATEAADYLVRKGLPFRKAHQLVGALVREAMDKETSLEDLPLSTFRASCELFESDLFESLSLEGALASKSSPGGTSPQRVGEALSEARDRLASGAF